MHSEAESSNGKIRERQNQFEKDLFGLCPLKHMYSGRVNARRHVISGTTDERLNERVTSVQRSPIHK